MIAQSSLPAAVQRSLRCPICRAPLCPTDNGLQCTSAECPGRFPIVDGIPILINEGSSVFAISDFVEHQRTTYRPRSTIERVATAVLPEIGANLKAQANYERFARLLLMNSETPTVLVVGGSVVGRGMASLLAVPTIQLVETDVTFADRTAIICDAHDLPFEDGAFDGVIIQAVLEHVADPYRCVEEIHRVLRADGLVYAETPFMQQVHGGSYDFTRFTHLGHRRLFRKFEEICSGAAGGPAMALAWSYQYFLLSFVRSSFARSALKAFARASSFWLKYFDYHLIDKPGALDAASGYYFMGRRSNLAIPDRELIKLYRGAGAVLPAAT